MIYRKQTGFNEFHCIADRCPKSCCEGWQIIIDEESLNRYALVSGPFSEQLRTGIDYRESCFLQHAGRCSMLSETGLCKLQIALGEVYLCDTCRKYPRHEEKFFNLREYSLSLSCPEAVRMLTEPAYDFFLTESTDETFDQPEEYEDFDPYLFDALLDSRAKMLEMAGQQELPLQKRMQHIAAAALELQELYDFGDLSEMGDVAYDGTQNTAGTGAAFAPDYLLRSLNVLSSLEVLEESWVNSIDSVRRYWSALSPSSEEWKRAMYPSEDLEFVFEKVFKSLLFSYYCGSVYDGQIYARTMLAVSFVRWLMMISHAQPDRSLAETIWLFSREIEHSDININTLISHFEEEID